MESISRMTLPILCKLFHYSVSVICIFILLTSKLLAQSPLTEIEYYEDNTSTNQISYFDNRFRLDSQLDEVTFVFYRVSGSAPVILVRPDGTKIKINQHEEDRVTWYEDKTYDLVKIKSPMAGPWQVIGNVLPNSKIMLVTDVTMEVEPLPSLILSGETLKLKAKLSNGGKEIKNSGFREVVQLNVQMFSSNNALYDNFAAEPVKLTSFLDDGRGLDEKPGDHIFTGEFNLAVSPGEWIPEYFITLPTFERKLIQDPIILHPYPVEPSVVASTEKSMPHKLTLTIDNEFVNAESLLFQGKIVYPNEEPKSFSLTEFTKTIELKKRIVHFDNIDIGVHSIEVDVFGETIDGREFRLTLPEFTFNVAAPEIVDESDDEQLVSSEEQRLMEEIRQQALEAERKLAELKAQKEKEQEERDFMKMMIIIIGNVVLFIIAIIGFFLYRRKLKKNSA